MSNFVMTACNWNRSGVILLYLNGIMYLERENISTPVKVIELDSIFVRRDTAVLESPRDESMKRYRGYLFTLLCQLDIRRLFDGVEASAVIQLSGLCAPLVAYHDSA
jgi:hypothetical protein